MAKIRTLQSTHQLDARLHKTPASKPPTTPKHKSYFKDHFPKVVAYVYLSRYVKSDHVFCRFPNVFNNKRTCDRHLSQSGLPLAQPIWYRGRDATDWIEDYRVFVAHLKQGRGQKPHQHKKTYVKQKLKQMPRACLLPKPV